MVLMLGWMLSMSAEAKAPPKAPEAAPAVVDSRDKSTKWVQDSEEYYRLTEQTYAMAEGLVMSHAAYLPEGTVWVVVMDADETVLDNTQYQVENKAFSEDSWAAWEARREARAMPGAVGFVAAIHRAGGRVAYVTNRRDAPAATDVMVKLDMFAEGDRMCTAVRDEAAGKWISDKRPRREQVRTGVGDCSWGEPVVVLGYFGDQMGDFPDLGELPALTNNASPWGQTYFLLPNPMYGKWEKAPNRTVPR